MKQELLAKILSIISIVSISNNVVRVFNEILLPFNVSRKVLFEEVDVAVTVAIILDTRKCL